MTPYANPLSLRTYILNGVSDLNEDPAQGYDSRLKLFLAGEGIYNTTTITVFDKTTKVTDITEVIGEMLKVSDINMAKIVQSVKQDIDSGKIKVGDTINMLAYSGSGQPAIRAITDLWNKYKIKVNLVLYGAPVFLTSGMTGIVNLAVMNGTKDDLISMIKNNSFFSDQYEKALGLLSQTVSSQNGKFLYKYLNDYMHADSLRDYHGLGDYSGGYKYISYFTKQIADFLSSLIYF